MTTTVIQNSFSAGEVSPSLWGRTDMAKYKVGTALMRNFFVDYRGGASNRPGTEFIGRAKSTGRPRLLPFEFSTEQTYILEFGDQYMRVIKDGAYVLEANKTITGVTNANPGVITSAAHGFSDGDWVYISSVGGTTSLNGRTFIVAGAATNTFTLQDMFGAAVSTVGAGVYTSGGTAARVYTLATPWAEADLPLIKYTQSADVMTLVHADYPPYDLGRTGHAAWTLTEITFASTIAPPGTVTATPSSAGSTGIGYVVTAVDKNGQESIASTPAIAASVNITTTAGYVTAAWSQVPGADYYNIYRATIANGAGVPAGATYGYVGTSFGVQFTDGNIVPDFTKTPPIHANPFAKSAILSITITNGGTGYSANTTASITDGTGSGALISPIVVGGVIVGFLINDAGHDYSSPSVTLAATGGGTGFAATVTVGPSTGTYPGTVAYFQQRKYFGASGNQPETLWASKPGSFKNMDKSNPVNDSDSLQLTVYSQKVNAIKHMIPMPGGLVLLSSSGAWQLSGGQQNAAVTPTSALAQAQAYNGCSDVPPIVINYDILYVQSKGSIVRDLAYNFFVNIYTGTDITVLSNHLFSPRRIQEWAYAEEPLKLVWAVRDDGTLLSLTFLKEQEVQGWARHDTQGLFQSVAVVEEDGEDGVYFVVKRKVNGNWYNYVERLASRVFPTLDDLSTTNNSGVEDSWFVDSGLSNSLTYPAAGATISGLTGSVTLTATAAVFSSGDVGKILRIGGGIGRVTAYTDTTHVTVLMTTPVSEVIPGTSVAIPAEEGEWSLTTPFTTVSGLWHLEGQTVKVLGDGNVFPDATVTNGQITLSRAVSRVIVGLGYTSQMQTLDLDIDNAGGTVQGKKKKLSALVVKVQNSRGLKAGPKFTHLTEFKQRTASVPMGQPIPLETGQQKIIMDPMWTVEGRICLQQDYPLPLTILAVIPELTVGDM